MTLPITWTGIKLLTREPLTLLMSLLFPVVLMVLLAGSFGNDPDGDFGGIGGVDFYVPIYAAATVAVMGFLGLPTHLASYRESGVFRRYRAAGIPGWVVMVALAVVTGLLAVVGTAIMLGLGLAFMTSTPPSLPSGWRWGSGSEHWPSSPSAHSSGRCCPPPAPSRGWAWPCSSACSS